MGIDTRRILTGRRLLITAVTAAVVAGGGAATAVAAGQDDADEGVPSGTRVTAAQAAQTALKAAPGTVEEIDLDDDDGGRTGWEVDVVTSAGERRTLTVDAASGKVVENRADRDDDEDGRDAAAGAKALGAAKTTAAAAAKAAAGAASGTVTSVDFDRDGGGAAWEVEVVGSNGTEHDVTVDAASGKVLQNLADDENDDENDDDQDDD